MPGFFRCLGATGQAQNTAFFGGIAGNYNVLSAAHPTSFDSGTDQYYNASFDNYVQANFINTWTIYNTSFTGGPNFPVLSLGGLAVAPDGSNVGQKIIESSDSGNTQHFLSAGYSSSYVGLDFALRVAFFAKPAERTRIACYVWCGFNACNFKVVFDLAGAQIGVAPVIFNQTGDPAGFGTPTIQPYGNTGWLYCTFDFYPGNSANRALVSLMLDAGSGTGAEDTKYTGDGASGLYVWRATCMPPGAWRMANQVTFFEDFNSIADIDVNNTAAPGFTWWPKNTWPLGNYSLLLPTPSSSINVAGSILTLGPSAAGSGDFNLATAVHNTGQPGNYASSFLFQPSGVIEFKCTADTIGGETVSSAESIWSVTVETLLAAGASDMPIQFELDFFETGGLNILPVFNAYTYILPSGSLNGVGLSANYGIFVPVYNANVLYQQGSTVYFNGVLYSDGSSSTGPGNAPPNSPWTVFTPTGISYAPPQIDYHTTLNVFTFVWIANNPASQNEGGCMMVFLNGAFCGFVCIYGPYARADQQFTQYQYAEKQHWPIVIGVPMNDVMKVDYVKVIQ